MPRIPPGVVVPRKLTVMANSHELLVALNTLLNINDKVMKLAKGAILPPRLNLFERHII